ncbi:RNase H family protein [Deinococcus yavapaiensis]|uniref:Reverse transcriptase-like protein n=1 Tax=Deinococcus yavapaiensis KR-236 TaxID=694435 RepID=A0A318S7W1_9DEIO|nr:RNase H family protein [Deinococcus yavapaiensis]PYE54104.1 reverse transcriptase-like protein [Deinococcus yavapaiensis KR-236]
MNHAFADGSQADGVGGWGVVLLVPGRPDARHSGQDEVNDNGACELLAVLHAIELAPEGQPLTVHTDATTVVQAIRRGTMHPEQEELGARVRARAAERGIRLRVSLGPRDARRMREAHDLAAAARRGEALPNREKPEVRVRVRKVAWGAEASFTIRRGGETSRVLRVLPPKEGVPPAVLALSALVREARGGEHLLVRMDSALAPALWANATSAATREAREIVEAAKSDAAARGVTLEFVA